MEQKKNFFEFLLVFFCWFSGFPRSELAAELRDPPAGGTEPADQGAGGGTSPEGSFSLNENSPGGCLRTYRRYVAMLVAGIRQRAAAS